MTDDDDAPDVAVFRRGAHGISTRELAAAVRERLPDARVVRATTPAAERAAVRNAPIAVGHSFDESLVEEIDALRLFACASAGVDSLPLDALGERGVTVTNASGVHATNMSEFVLGGMLSFASRFGQFRRQAERHEWHRAQGTELYGSTVTVVGLGPIGTAVVDRLEPFGVDTVGVRYTPAKGGPTDEVIGYDEDALHEALSRTDYLVLACPLTDETRGLVGAAELQTLEPHAVVVNVARGPVVDTDALLYALQDNAVGGAVLDVTDPEPLPGDHDLWRQSNAFVTPHASGHTPAYYDRVADILAENVRRIRETDSYDGLRNQVDGR